VNQTGVIWECPKEGMKKESTTKMTAESLRTRPAFLNAPNNQQSAGTSGRQRDESFRTHTKACARNQWNV